MRWSGCGIAADDAGGVARGSLPPSLARACWQHQQSSPTSAPCRCESRCLGAAASYASCGVTVKPYCQRRRRQWRQWQWQCCCAMPQSMRASGGRWPWPHLTQSHTCTHSPPVVAMPRPVRQHSERHDMLLVIHQRRQASAHVSACGCSGTRSVAERQRHCWPVEPPTRRLEEEHAQAAGAHDAPPAVAASTRNIKAHCTRMGDARPSPPSHRLHTPHSASSARSPASSSLEYPQPQ